MWRVYGMTTDTGGCASSDQPAIVTPHPPIHSTLRLGRDLPHGFFGLYDLDPSATKIMDEASGFLRGHLLSPHASSSPAPASSILVPLPRAEREESDRSDDPCAGLEGSGDGDVAMLVMAGAAYHHAQVHAQAAAGGASGQPLSS